jgi:hypothetical protein
MLMWRYIRNIAFAAMLLIAGGCAFTGVRREPASPPAFKYANPQLRAVLHDIPVAIDYADCVETAMVNKRSIFGSVSFAGTFPFRHIVLREFGRFINENMRSPLDGEAERVVLKIYSKRILVEQKWSKSRTEMVFDIQLLDPKSEDARPYFRSSFSGEWSSAHKDDTVIPESVYRCIGNIIGDFASALASDRSAMRRLSFVAQPQRRLVPPSLKEISFGEINNGVVSGRCVVDCNGWDGFNADKWARGQINSSCCMKFGSEPERMRVVYFSDSYDAAAKRWRYEFKAFVRAPMVIDYNPVTRSGICIGDLGLLSLAPDAAAFKMKEFVIGEMRTRAGLVSSASGLNEVRVRFGAVSSDPVGNTMQMEFTLPY